MVDDSLTIELERLKAENERLKRDRGRTVSLKVSEKRGVSVYGVSCNKAAEASFANRRGQVGVRRQPKLDCSAPFRRDTSQRMAAVSRTCRLPSRRPSRFFQ